MSPFLLYIARAGLYLSLFYAFYLLVMRRTTFFQLNRVLLLAGSYLCLLLPVIRLRTVAEASGVAQTLTIQSVAVGEPADWTLPAAFPWKNVLLAFYIAGALATLALYLISAHKMRRVIRRAEKTEREGCRLVLLDENIPSFSWGRTVVMGRKDLEENPAIFTHEQMHVQCRHSLDLLLFLPLQMLFWWNPLVWVTREELRLLHEYEADEGVLQKGIDATQYQLLLVRKAVGEQRFSLASGFQHAKLKNRIEMMLKPTSSGWMRWSYLALIPVLAVFMFACNPNKKSKTPAPEALEQEAVEQEAPAADPAATKSVGADVVECDLPDPEASEKEPVPFSLLDVKPKFNGGDANEFVRWVNSQLKYPEQAVKDQVEGRVLIQFTIGTDGVVRDVKLLRGVREDLDNEALKIVASSPKWEPGQQNGKAVPVHFNFPVVYKLQ